MKTVEKDLIKITEGTNEAFDHVNDLQDLEKAIRVCCALLGYTGKLSLYLISDSPPLQKVIFTDLPESGSTDGSVTGDGKQKHHIDQSNQVCLDLTYKDAFIGSIVLHDTFEMAPHLVILAGNLRKLAALHLKLLTDDPSSTFITNDLQKIIDGLPYKVLVTDLDGTEVTFNRHYMQALCAVERSPVEDSQQAYQQKEKLFEAEELRKLIGNTDQTNIIKSIALDGQVKNFIITWTKLSLLGKDLVLFFINEKNDDTIHDLGRKDRFEHIIEHATDFIYECDHNGKFIYVNPTCQFITGYPRVDFCKMSYTDIIHPDHKEEVVAFYQHQFHKRIIDTYFEFPIITQNGKKIWIGQKVHMILKNGWIQGFEALARDISERKHVEAKLIEAQKDLEKIVQAKEQFISVMSHEIRTPLSSVVGMADLLLQGQHAPEQREYLNVLKISADNLLNILNNVLDLSKIEAGKMSFDYIPFDLAHVLENIRKTFLFKAAEKNIGLTVKIDKDVPLNLAGDVMKLNQILLNLVANAIKFTEEGRVEITVKVLEETLQEAKLVFYVKDTGIGIQDEKLQNIFESFTQADNNITRKYGGSGLGLNISRKLIRLMGGEIEVESQVGKGSCFYFNLRFKKVAGDLSLIHDIVKEPSHNLNGIKILLAEDNEMNRMVASKFLNNYGIQVDIAENGLIALEKVRTNTYDLVLMDMQMPEMDGYEATRAIRAIDGPHKNIPILALTASTSLRSDPELFNDLISKPFDTKVLLAKIAKLIRYQITHTADTMEKKPENTLTDLNYLKEASAGNKAFIMDMIRIFLKQTPTSLQQLNTFGKEENWTEFRKVMHKMKPTISMMGIYSMEKTIKEIEACAKEQKDLHNLPALLNTLEKACFLAFDELKAELVEMEAST